MNPAARIEALLKQYAEWQNAIPADLWVNSSAEPEVIDGVSCPPDGGMSRFVQRHNQQMRVESAARSIQDALQYLPPAMRQVFDATYVGLPYEVPRSERDAAERLDISLNKYQKLKFGLLMWFQGFHFRTFSMGLDP